MAQQVSNKTEISQRLADQRRSPLVGIGAVAWRMAQPVLVAYLVILLMLMLLERRMIFFPRPYDGSVWWKPQNLDFEDVFFEADDGTRLHAWYCPHPTPRGFVLFAHGNAGNIAGRADVAAQLQRMGLSVFLFDYRGYGRSEGQPDEQGILADARAARAELARLAEIAETDVILMGRSLGSGVVVDLAARDGALGLILESSFTSLPDVAAIHYPWLPVRRFMRTRLDSASLIGNYTGPLLQSHGDYDRTIPIQLGQRLFEAAGTRGGAFKQFFTVPGGDHNDMQPPDYYALLSEFIDSLPQPGAAGFTAARGEL